MSVVLHRAIREAIAQTPTYEEKAILVSQILEATNDVAGHQKDVYDAVHHLFTVMPTRLVRGSMFLVSTQDVHNGVELAWDAREETRPGYTTGQGITAAYEPDEPIALALRTLERVCEMRAGYVRTSHESISNSSSFPRRPYLHRRVVAHLPLPPEVAKARADQAKLQAEAPARVDVTLTPAKKDPWRAVWPSPRPHAPVVTMRARK